MPRMQKKVHGSRRRPAKASRPDSRNNHDVSGWYWGCWKVSLALRQTKPEPVFVQDGVAYAVWFERKNKKFIPKLINFAVKSWILKGPITCTNI